MCKQFVFKVAADLACLYQKNAVFFPSCNVFWLKYMKSHEQWAARQQAMKSTSGINFTTTYVTKMLNKITGVSF